MRERPALRSALVLAVATVLLAGCGGSSVPDGPLKEGRSIYGSTCSACHGTSGDGGVGPSLHEVLDTFPTCEEQIKWVTLGSERWKSEVGDTYGATNRPIETVMPEMGLQLTTQEIASVVAFERSTYGGLPADEALRECGFDVVDASSGS